MLLNCAHVSLHAFKGYAQSFSEDLAVVCIGGDPWEGGGNPSARFGFIDKAGTYVINPQFEWAWDFSDGVAKIRMGGMWNHPFAGKFGFIDNRGNYIWEPSE